ncbi:2-phospho-L-lactate guanylyltransferase [Salipiger sp. P9]|uniref:2-phospho-L-lactate guanylyltransferase n=1 Tax=Salipiger pentaromativorans TaxID=2943193 RepID=UPI002157F3B6|nr:2-phospho-L-lactate guanylyltransferase [Salipiger pentaromativorans]MCR8547513.1 2-phospho-L-lactate guanylyltransferase [Salipiger pentaromativorans]
MTLQAVIPVKRFEAAKSRLSGHLLPQQRAALAEAMFRDVLGTAQAAGIFTRIAVVTACPKAGAIARAAGAQAIPDPRGAAGTNAAVTAALDALPRHGGTMILQADLPLLAPDDLRRIARAHGAGQGVTLVPALDGGTTILALAAPAPIRPAFGPQSFARHIAAARAAGIEPQLLAPRNALCDLDRPADLALLAACRPQSHSAQLARQLGRAAPTTLQDGERHAERLADTGLLSFS